VLGLVGYAATFVTGFFFLRPASERIGADTGVLIAMALILAAGIGYILVSLRAVDAQRPQPAGA
jgi:hypothetical protein